MKKTFCFLLMVMIVGVIGCSKAPEREISISDTSSESVSDEVSGEDLSRSDVETDESTKGNVNDVLTDTTTSDTKDNSTTNNTIINNSVTETSKTQTQAPTTAQIKTETETTTKKSETPTVKVAENNNIQSNATLCLKGISDEVLTSAKKIVNSIITSSMTELEKVTAIHDYLVKTVDYDKSKADIHTAKGALINKVAVCDGYAEGFAVLCYTAGVQAEMVFGTAIDSTGNLEPHAWNNVRIDGIWFNVDVTWDDPIVNGMVVKDGSNISYKYFLISDAKISKTHTADNSKKYACNSDKYAEYATNLTWKALVDSQYPYVVVTNMSDAKTQMKSFINNGKKTFQIIYSCSGATDAQMESIWNGLQSTYNDVIKELQVYGSFGISGSMSSDGYVLAKFTITN